MANHVAQPESSSEEMSDVDPVGDSSVDEPVDEVLSDEAGDSFLSEVMTPGSSELSLEIGGIRSRHVSNVSSRWTTPSQFDSADEES